MGWQWRQLDQTQIICTLLQTDNHASTSPLSFFTGQMPFLPPNQQRQRIETIPFKSPNGSKEPLVFWARTALATHHPKRHPDPISRFATIQFADRPTDRQTDGPVNVP